NKIKIDYQLPPTPTSPPPTPILAVRLQELFGQLETPRILNNRLPLLLHLLSPGYKPIQITQDLKSFWTTAYFEVRKDLRTRYPKHKWPENPLAATPESKGRPHR
ncbi:MAG: ATP-dependent helicase C-terminal domain-containing protein, partial [Phycisphaerae bacterium]